MLRLKRFEVISKAETDTDARTDVSIISTRTVDAEGDIIIPEGLDWDRFHESGSPVNVAHTSLRIGKALWVKSDNYSVRAKTQYDRQPKDWPFNKPWPADVVFSAVARGLLRGKSITLLPTEERPPTDAEAKLGVQRVISKGLVEEYSVCAEPVNPEALVESVQKALLGFDEAGAVMDDMELVEEIVEAFRSLKAGDVRA